MKKTNDNDIVNLFRTKKFVNDEADRSLLNETSAVGIFEEGKSDYGLYDVAGNVYEWIATGVSLDENGEYKREKDDLEGKFERLVKGGSWNLEYERSKAAYDEWDFPYIFDQNTGLRPVIVLKE